MIALLSIIGVGLLIPAFGALVWDIFQLFETGSFKLSTWGELWYDIHPPSLNLYQASVERHISASLWDDVLAPMLFWPAVFAFGVPGFILALLPTVERALTRDAGYN